MGSNWERIESEKMDAWTLLRDITAGSNWERIERT